jgi:two-component system, chemotaxis family, protein-glutamate methylesterase/glutaminase
VINRARLRRDVAVIGGSAGAIESLLELVGKLPTGFEAAVAVVVHLNPFRESKLANVLTRSATIPVAPVSPGAPFERGHVYVAVADHHLLVGPTLSISRGPKEHLHRPAIDPLFRSAAASFGARVVGVLLSGATTDGVTGAAAIRAAGGIVLVQDPAGAQYPRLPATALTQDTVDASASIAELAEILTRLPRGETLNDR